MAKTRIKLLVPALILAVTLPGALAVAYFKLSGDPTMQPLAITIKKLAEGNSNGQATGIIVEVGWGQLAKPSNTRQEVRQALHMAMSVYGIDYTIRFLDITGDKIAIFFITGSGRMGPYQLANVSSGIMPAIAAFRIQE